MTLTPVGDETIVRLRHFNLPVAERDQHRMGWDHYLARLAIAASGRDPGVDPWTQPDAGMDPHGT